MAHGAIPVIAFHRIESTCIYNNYTCILVSRCIHLLRKLCHFDCDCCIVSVVAKIHCKTYTELL